MKNKKFCSNMNKLNNYQIKLLERLKVKQVTGSSKNDASHSSSGFRSDTYKNKEIKNIIQGNFTDLAIQKKTNQRVSPN